VDLNAIRADVAGKLTAAGVRNVTADPSKVQPPCVLVDLPTVLVDSPQARVEVRIRVIATPPGGAHSVRRLLEDVGAVVTELRCREARPERYEQGGLDCPAYSALSVVNDTIC
jgi:hypothetical protein